MIFLKRFIIFGFMLVSSVAFGALNTGSMLTPEMIAKMRYANSYFDLQDGIEAGKIDLKAVLTVASNIEAKLAAIQEASDMTLCSGVFYNPLVATRVRLGTGTCEAGFYFLGIGCNPSIKTKNLLIATAAVIALTVVYKKGYFEKIKNYFIKTSENDEEKFAN